MNANIVFDLDGTLIDSAPDIQGIANMLLAARNLEPINIQTTRGFVGRGAPNFVKQLCDARGIPPAEQSQVLQDFIAHYDTAVDLTHPYPGVEAALSQLVKTNRLGICTNKPYRPCLAVLKSLKLEGYFKAILGGDSLPVRKPDPAPLRETFERMGAGAQVYVGDSEVDAETASRAGVPFILFGQGYRKSPISALEHVAVFEDFTTLPTIVATLLGDLKHTP